MTQTTWRELKFDPAYGKEADLQAIFNVWHERPRARLFGVPDWLDLIDHAPLSRGPRPSFGYEFTTDVEFVVGSLRYVLELKYGAKFEPLALAEVLHHAAWLRRYEAEAASHVVPVIVSQYSSWLRLAVDEYLRGVVRLVEVCMLEGVRGEPLFVFDAPLAPWSVKATPSWLTDLTEESAKLHWHYVAETRSWFGLQRERTVRPHIMDEPYVWVVGGGGKPVVVWEGLAGGRVGRRSPLRSESGLNADGRYFLHTPGQPGDPRAVTPTWLRGV